MTTKVGDRFRVTLPSKVRHQFRLEVGDPLEVEATEEAILLKPKKLVDASQAYFWTKAWQEKERQSAEDYRRGRYKTARGVDDFFRKLNG